MSILETSVERDVVEGFDAGDAGRGSAGGDVRTGLGTVGASLRHAGQELLTGEVGCVRSATGAP